MIQKLHAYLSALGFNLLNPNRNHCGGDIITDIDKQVKVLFIVSTDAAYKDLLVMDVFDVDGIHPKSIIAKQQVSTTKALKQHMLNSYELKRLCPALYQKVLETPA